MKKGLTRRLFTCLFTFFISTLSFSSVFAAGNPFELTNLSIADKSSTVEGTAGLNTSGEIENNVVFHAVGDWVKYLLELKNTSSEELTITSISDDSSNSYITYSYSDHTGETVAAGASLQLEVTATYANAVTDLNARAQSAAMKISIGYTTPSGTAGDADIVVPNTGDNTEGGASASAGMIVAFAVVGTIAAVIALVIIKYKKNTSALFMFVLAFAFVFTSLSIAGVSASEALSSELEFDGSFSLFDKLAVSYDIDGNSNVQSIGYGMTVGDLETPSRDGYSFTRWLDGNGRQVNASTVIEGDLELFPDWSLKTAILNTWCGGSSSDSCGYVRFADYTYNFTERMFMKRAKNLGLQIGGVIADEFTRASSKPSDDLENVEIISTNNSRYPVYMWYDADSNTLYWWSEAGKVSFPEYSKYAFWKFPAKKIDLRGFDVSDVRNMYGFFENSKAEEIIFGDNFDTSSTYDMGALFYGCSNLAKVDLEHLDTSNNYYFDYMFANTGFKTLDISMLDINDDASKLNFMFSYDKNLTSLTLPQFSASGKDFNRMFDGASSIETIDISPISFSMDDDWYCPNIEEMFFNVANLTTIYANSTVNDFPSEDWDCVPIDEGRLGESEYTRDFNVFYKSNKLVGGNGSTYPAAYLTVKGYYPYPGDEWEGDYYVPANEAKLFRIDGYGNKPGMFTLKQ